MQVEVAELMSKIAGTSVTVSRGGNRASGGQVTSSFHRIPMGGCDISLIAVLSQESIHAVRRLVSTGDSGANIRVPGWICRRDLVSILAVADNLAFATVEATINEGHVVWMVEDLAETTTVVHRHITVANILVSKSAMKCLGFQKMVCVLKRSGSTDTLIRDGVYVDAAWGSLIVSRTTLRSFTIILGWLLWIIRTTRDRDRNSRVYEGRQG